MPPLKKETIVLRNLLGEPLSKYIRISKITRWENGTNECLNTYVSKFIIECTFEYIDNQLDLQMNILNYNIFK